MANHSGMNLTAEQQTLLRAMVEAYQSGIKGQFIFTKVSVGNASLIYQGKSLSVNADYADFLQLGKEDLITLGRTSRGNLCGKVTQLGIDAILQEAAGDPDEASLGVLPETGTKAPGRVGRGFPANATDHEKVAKAASQLKDGWASNLPHLCELLHSVGAEFPDRWVKDEGVDSWMELAHLLDGPSNAATRERLTKYITYRVEWVRAHR
jgi:hypothetical protein